jgi:hypothetical protein
MIFNEKRSVAMKAGKRVAIIAIVCIAAITVFFVGIRNAEAGPRGDRAVEGPRGNVAVEGPRGNVAVGTRVATLPDSVTSVMVGERMYYRDDSGVYYVQCDDDDSSYCVVPAPATTDQ